MSVGLLSACVVACGEPDWCEDLHHLMPLIFMHEQFEELIQSQIKCTEMSKYVSLFYHVK